MLRNKIDGLAKSAMRLIVFLTAVVAVVLLLVAGGQYVSGRQLAAGGERQSLEIPSLEQAALGLYLRLHQDEIARPAGASSTPVPFTVQPGETAATIASRLQRAGLIRDADLFRLLLRYQGADARLEAGEYQLRPTMTMEQIIAALQHAPAETVTVTIPEGWRAEEIAAFLHARGLADQDEFLKLVAGGRFDYAFLRDRPPGSSPSLEGYLFPDTYQVPPDIGATRFVDLMLRTFDQRFTPQMRQAVAAQGKTIHQVVILASIVEREAVLNSERPTIASVYLNRLKQGMYLQADPTVQYAKGYDETTGKWWNSMRQEEAQTVDSPYNTFLHSGLPPGPICNPGLAALQAVVQPAATDYLFFYSRGDGSHAFATTYEEHLENQQKYRR